MIGDFSTESHVEDRTAGLIALQVDISSAIC